MLLHGLKQSNYRGQVAIASSARHDSKVLAKAGVDLLLIPYADAAKEAADQLLARTAARDSAPAAMPH